MKMTSPIWLASSSPRRRQMLTDAGVEIQVRPSDIDDGLLRPRDSSTPAHWVMALAYLKARRVADDLRGWIDRHATWHGDSRTPTKGIVLGADTVCVVDGRILGQPRDAVYAREMLNSMRNRTHETITGVCLISLPTAERRIFADRTQVHVGRLTDRQIDEYLASGDWKGKAGGYNLSERQAAGWPIEIEGDPGTVMGLPMRRLIGMLPTRTGIGA